MRYAIAGLLSLCLSLQAGVGVVAADAQPAQRTWLLFMRDQSVWAVTADGGETKGPLAVGGAVHDLAASPDGRYVAVAAGDNSELRVFRLLPDLRVADLEGPRAGLPQVAYCEWSPNGRYVAAISLKGIGLCVFRVVPDGEVVEIARLGPGLGRAKMCWWSPDGRYVTVRTEDAVHILSWRTGEDGLGAGRVVLPPLLSVDSEPVVWSAESDAIAYREPAGYFARFVKSIWVTDVPSGRTRQIQLADWALLYDLSWRPDGRVFTYGGWDGVRSVPADGSAQESLLVEGKGQFFQGPSWSPDGAFLAYARSWAIASGGHPASGLWMLDTRSKANTQLTANGIVVWEPSLSWSHDGRLVSFFARDHSVDHGLGSYALYVADVASGAVRRVADGFGMPSFGWWKGSHVSPVVWLPSGAPRGDEDRHVGDTRPK